MTFMERSGMSQVISAMPSASTSSLKLAMTFSSYGENGSPFFLV
jgi:hypothetical protein